jgi:hypothetical protein
MIDYAECLENSTYTEAFTDIVQSGAVCGSDDYLRMVEGIAAQIDSPKGRALSPKQRAVVHNVVNRYCETHHCPCGNSEVGDVVALLRSGLCSYHEYYSDRD